MPLRTLGNWNQTRRPGSHRTHRSHIDGRSASLVRIGWEDSAGDSPYACVPNVLRRLLASLRAATDTECLSHSAVSRIYALPSVTGGQDSSRVVGLKPGSGTEMKNKAPPSLEIGNSGLGDSYKRPPHPEARPRNFL